MTVQTFSKVTMSTFQREQFETFHKASFDIILNGKYVAKTKNLLVKQKTLYAE